MTDPKKDNGANLPMIGLGLILAAGAGVVVGWYMHKPPAQTPTKAATVDQLAKPGTPSAPAGTTKPAEAAATGAGANDGARAGAAGTRARRRRRPA
jgi:hypothetical protein